VFAAGGAARRNPHAALGKGQYRHHDLSPSILIEVDEMLNAVLVGLDRGKGVTIPTLPGVAAWGAYEEWRCNMIPKLATFSCTP